MNSSEQLFCEIFSVCDEASFEDNVHNHIDLFLGFTVDVKGMKKVNRSDSTVSFEYTWLEITNVRGHPGWIYSKADYIAFERPEYWVLVKPEDLQALVNQNLKSDKGKGPWEIYSRKNRDDLITLVPIEEIADLAKIIVKK